MTLTETWKHKLTKELSSTVSAGFAWYSSEDPQGGHNEGFFPVASVGLQGGWNLVRRRSYTISLQATSAMTPVVNMYTGTLQQRVQAASTLGIAGKKSSLSFTLSGGESLPVTAPDAVGVVGAGILATHNPLPFMQLSAGYRTAWQVANAQQADTIPRLWAAFVGLALYAPPVHF